MIATPKTLLQLETLLDHIAYFNNGHDFASFKKMVDTGWSERKIAIAFGRDRRTISKWKQVYKDGVQGEATRT